MESSERNRVSDLYHRALARAPEARSAFLAVETAGNVRLREEVESLLACEPTLAAFLEQPAVARFGPRFLHRDLLGRQVGQYTVVAHLGTGGMGEVYRAHDSKLGRDVALKILPAHYTGDPERRQRFVREARLLATLNHPNIGAIYGFDDIDGHSALVLELVEGTTLADRIAHGPLAVAEALTIGRQIADALAAAHDKRIVHRDLKPANIVLQVPSGSPASVRAKVLDFGLAKTIAGSDGPLDAPSSGALDSTIDGRILGTPGYMSPEQARGETVDRRTDIWAFGCVLFEMLSGKPAFGGPSPVETLAAVMTCDPEWTALPVDTSPEIRSLLRRCLRKDPDKRLHDIADARIELDEGVDPRVVTESKGIPTRRWSRSWYRLGWIVALGVAVTTIAFAVATRRNTGRLPLERLEFAIAPPEGGRFTGTSPEFAISPDGRFIVFAATSKSSSELWLHSLASGDARTLPATQGGRNPFWSPDGRSIGFFANNHLKTIQVTNGSPITLCAAPGTTGGSIPHSGAWSSQGRIIFSGLDGLRQVSAAGGESALIIPSTGNKAWPAFLPDGDHFLYNNCCGTEVDLRLASLSAGDIGSLGIFESQTQYVAGHLFFVRGGNLMVQRVDAETRRLDGDATHLGIQVGMNPAWDRGVYAVSHSGRLVYRATARTLTQLTWMDRRGLGATPVGTPNVVNNLALSPDGLRLATGELTHVAGKKSQFDIWVRDLATGRNTRVTDDIAWDFEPAWSRDGAHIAFMSNRPYPTLQFSLFVRAADGSGRDAALVTSPSSNADWGSDGTLVYSSTRNRSTGSDLLTLSMRGDRTPMTFLATPHNEARPHFSPDGRWIAYQSDATGRNEIYVRRFPSQDPSLRVSAHGGTHARWRGDGKEIFFLSTDGTMMAAPIDVGADPIAGAPQALFATNIAGGKNYAAAKDGQRFLIPVDTDRPLRVIADWHSLLPK
jgi:eukaryotic-like serine/threonine-protein kinase